MDRQKVQEKNHNKPIKIHIVFLHKVPASINKKLQHTSNNLIKLCYVLFHLQIHKEIDSAVGDRAPSLDDRDSLPFTRATLLEVMRCRVGTLSIPHLANDDAVVGGCFIQKGSHVMANLWALHHDPLVWEEPEKFNPCRFLSGDESAIVLPDYFMPFGAGE